MPDAFQIPGFPFLQQPDDISCGPTCAAMVLQHFGFDVSIDQVRTASCTDWFHWRGKPFGMTHPAALQRAMRHFAPRKHIVKMDAGGISSPLLIDYDMAGASVRLPAICLLRVAPRIWHYVVSIGCTPTEVITADPWEGACVHYPAALFGRAWEFTGDLAGEAYGWFDPVRWALRAVGVTGKTVIGCW